MIGQMISPKIDDKYSSPSRHGFSSLARWQCACRARNCLAAAQRAGGRPGRLKVLPLVTASSPLWTFVLHLRRLRPPARPGGKPALAAVFPKGRYAHIDTLRWGGASVGASHGVGACCEILPHPYGPAVERRANNHEITVFPGLFFIWTYG